MRILAIDPSSNKIDTSTTGIVLLDNATLIDYWVVEYGVKNFKEWYRTTGTYLDHDVVVVEKFIERDNSRAKDNSVLDTIDGITRIYPEAVLQNNSGYATDVPDALLKALGLWKFDKSHHQDVRSAARLGLFYAIGNDVEEVVQAVGEVVDKAFDNIEKMARRGDTKK